MADIEMCLSRSCTIKAKCLRWTADPRLEQQAFRAMKQNDDKTCNTFVTNADQDKYSRRYDGE